MPFDYWEPKKSRFLRKTIWELDPSVIGQVQARKLKACSWHIFGDTFIFLWTHTIRIPTFTYNNTEVLLPSL